MASGPAWSWPPWCLNHRDGQIEVFVNDEESGTARWVPGMAQTRIVDPNGQDAYLQVLYVWDGEEYVEDFAPPQVRAVGSAQTVEDLIRTGEIQSTRSLRETPAPADTSSALRLTVLIHRRFQRKSVHLHSRSSRGTPPSCIAKLVGSTSRSSLNVWFLSRRT